MKQFDKLRNIVIESKQNLPIQASLLGLINTMENIEGKRMEHRDIVEKCGIKNLLDIVMGNDDVIFYTVYSKNNDEWDVNFPFRSIIKNDKGNWERVSTVSPSLDLAYIAYLGQRYLGHNSGFANFAVRMLNIKI